MKIKEDAIKREEAKVAGIEGKLEDIAGISEVKTAEELFKKFKFEEDLETYNKLQQQGIDMKDEIQMAIDNLTGKSMLASLKSTKTQELVRRGNSRLTTINLTSELVKGRIDLANNHVDRMIGLL